MGFKTSGKLAQHDPVTGMKFRVLSESGYLQEAESICSQYRGDRWVFPPKAVEYVGPNVLFDWQDVEPYKSAYIRFLDSRVGQSLPLIGDGEHARRFFWTAKLWNIRMRDGSFVRVYWVPMQYVRDEPGYYEYSSEVTTLRGPVVCVKL